MTRNFELKKKGRGPGSGPSTNLETHPDGARGQNTSFGETSRQSWEVETDKASTRSQKEKTISFKKRGAGKKKHLPGRKGGRLV